MYRPGGDRRGACAPSAELTCGSGPQAQRQLRIAVRGSAPSVFAASGGPKVTPKLGLSVLPIPAAVSLYSSFGSVVLLRRLSPVRWPYMMLAEAERSTLVVFEAVEGSRGILALIARSVAGVRIRVEYADWGVFAP